MRFIYDAMAPTAAPSFNPAEYLARQGVKNESVDRPNEVPNITTEQKVEEPVKAETAAPVQPPAAPVAPTTKAVDWRDSIKGLPETEVLKTMGYDDKLIGLLNRWKSGGSVKEYLEAASVDYAKMDAEEVMKHHLQKQFGDLSKEDFEELYRMKVTENYKLDSDMYSEQEVKRGKILLNAEAKQIRENLIKQQQDYLMPAAPDQNGLREQEESKAQEEAQRELDAYRLSIESNPYVAELVKNKILPIGEGEDVFNFSVADTNNLMAMLFDGGSWGKAMKNADGSPNVQKLMLMAAIASDDKLLIQEFSKHFKTLGAKKAIEPIENAVPPAGAPASGGMSDLSPAAALARGGVIVSGE